MLGIYGPMVSRLQDVLRDILNSRTEELLEYRLVMRICGEICILTRLHAEQSAVCFSAGTSNFSFVLITFYYYVKTNCILTVSVINYKFHGSG